MTDPKINIVITVDGKQYTAAMADAGKETATLGKTADNTSNQVGGLSRNMKLLSAAALAYVSINTAKAALIEADAYKTLTARVANATKATGDFVAVNRELKDISIENGAALESSVSLFQSLARIAPELKRSNDEVLQLSDLVQKLGVVSGASATAMSSGMLQFTQGLAGGVFRAEEFNSILENIPEVAQRIAQGMGTTVGQLRKMVLDGKLLSSDVFDALLKQTSDINADFAAMPRRMSQGWNHVTTQTSAFAAGLDRALGTTGDIARVLDRIGYGLGKLVDMLPEIEAGPGAETKILNARTSLIKVTEQYNSTLLNLQSTQAAAASGNQNAAAYLETLENHAKNLKDQIIGLQDEIIVLSGGDAFEPITKSIKLTLESAEDFGNRLAALSREAYPQATKTAQEYGEEQAVIARNYLELVNNAEAYGNTMADIYRDMYPEATRTNEEYGASMAKLAREIYPEATSSTEEYGHRMAELARQAYPEATESAEEYGERMANVVTKTKDGFGELKSAANGWSRDFADRLLDGEMNMANFANEMLRQIARIAIAQSTQPLFDGIASGIGSIFTPSATPGVTPTTTPGVTPTTTTGVVAHSGAIVGSSDGGRRTVASSVFDGAPRYHAGGIVGDEVPAILKRKEGVFTPEQMKALGPGSQVINNIIINNNSGAEISSSVDERPNSSGGADIFLTIEKEMAGRVTGGGPLSKSIGQYFGVRRAV